MCILVCIRNLYQISKTACKHCFVPITYGSNWVIWTFGFPFINFNMFSLFINVTFLNVMTYYFFVILLLISGKLISIHEIMRMFIVTVVYHLFTFLSYVILSVFCSFSMLLITFLCVSLYYTSPVLLSVNFSNKMPHTVFSYF
jgi:hypothetical protein